MNALAPNISAKTLEFHHGKHHQVYVTNLKNIKTSLQAVTGDSLNELNDAVRQNTNISWIHVRHEEAGAFAASAEAQLNGLACCAGSSGPGHVHLINGLYDAHRSGAPVLAIASTCPTIEFGTDFFQETNVNKLFDDCSHYNQVATTPAQVPRMTQTALQHAIQKNGVSILGLPGDVMAMTSVENITSDGNYFSKAVIRPTDADLNTLVDLIIEFLEALPRGQRKVKKT